MNKRDLCRVQWAEGMIFKTFLAEGRVATPAEMPALTRDEYLGGVLDFAGELNRHAVLRATERDVDAVRRCRDTVDALMGVFLDVRPPASGSPFIVCTHGRVSLRAPTRPLAHCLFLRLR